MSKLCAMKKLYILLLAALSAVPFTRIDAQCPASYTQAQLNWDNLDYYYNAGLNVAPYGYRVSGTNYTYVSDANEQTQRFAIGSNYLTIANSSAAMINPAAGTSAENATHTGELAGYTGEDVEYTSVAGQTITITFNNPVRNATFTLYDIDLGGIMTVSAADAASGALTVTAATQAGTILTVVGAPNKVISDLTNLGAGTALGNADNRGSVTITVAGTAANPVKTITISCTATGTDPVFWLSDINACVTGSFPTNYHQLANNRPFVGPTQNMPDYFLVTPDNDDIYMIDPATGNARHFLNDPAKTYVNSLAYDPYNRFLYYISENVSVDYTNKLIKRYDYNTETSSTIIADLSAAFNIPTFNSGVESAGCAFYDGALYFGVEGGTHNNSGTVTTRETIIWRIDFDGSNNPVSAYQVFATNASTNGASPSSIHDWGDFIIRNGVVINSNTARNSSNYSQSKFHHYDMMTGAVTNVYNNPGTALWNGQIAMNWAQNLYYFRANGGSNSAIGTYDGAGNLGATQNITLLGTGGPWPGGAGDASDPFRPKCDFGDAPASYDPYANPAIESPAVHERADTMWLGTTTVESTSWSREFLKRGTNGTADSDNGVATVPFLQPGTSPYLAQVSLYNNSSANATVIAWLDFNGNGTFDAAEAGTNIPAGPITPSSSVQTRYLYWPSVTTPLLAGATTYLRIRITAAAASMTSSHATGYFEKGEVEDYAVPVDNYPLTTQLLNFKAILENKQVKLNWNVTEDANVYSYDVERSADNTNWSKVTTVNANGTSGTFSYDAVDANPLKGISYYRVRIIESAGMNRFSAIKQITLDEFTASFVIAPNPAKDLARLFIEASEAGEATIQILNMQGREVLSQKKQLKSGSNTIELPVAETISAGTYMVRLTTGTKVLQQKLIINK